ncbi:MAG TPA: hypothetical protein VEK57_02730 [Thermoanaerobaculia bacterium]|nr:hypothetical protein [Thermoanaerobaculia bacterium]
MPTTTNKDEHLIQPPQPGRNMHGWGADLSPADRPAVPKEKPSTVTTPRGVMPTRQVPTMRIHKSTEHPDLPPVFGTSCPPRGLSGKLRDVAYTFSEGQMTHWLTLMLADRVDVVEGLIEDLRHGKVPNLIRERGTDAVLTHESEDRFLKQKTVIYTAATIGVVAVALVALQQRRRR